MLHPCNDGRRTGYHGPCDCSLVAPMTSATLPIFSVAGEISMPTANTQDNFDGRAKAKGGGLVEWHGPTGWQSHRGTNCRRSDITELAGCNDLRWRVDNRWSESREEDKEIFNTTLFTIGSLYAYGYVSFAMEHN
jgi:hypothetical protein